MTFKNAAGKTYLKYDCSNKELSSLKTVPIWEQAEYVDFSINKLWDPREIYDFLKKLPQLKRIDLDKNYLAELPPQLFAHNHKLQFVNFLNNRLKTIPTLLFRNNAELEVVWFSGNQVCFALIQNKFTTSAKTADNFTFYFRSQRFLKPCFTIPQICFSLNLVGTKFESYLAYFFTRTNFLMRYD